MYSTLYKIIQNKIVNTILIPVHVFQQWTETDETSTDAIDFLYIIIPLISIVSVRPDAQVANQNRISPIGNAVPSAAPSINFFRSRRRDSADYDLFLSMYILWSLLAWFKDSMSIFFKMYIHHLIRILICILSWKWDL